MARIALAAQGVDTAMPSASVQKMAIKSVKPWHDEVARRLVIGCQSQKEIAEDLCVSQSWISILINQPLLKVKIQALREQRDNDAVNVAKQLDQASIGAVEIVERTMYRTKSEKLSVQCAQDILDRAGHGKVTKSINENRNINVNANMSREETMRMLTQRITQAKAESAARLEEIANAEAIDITFDEFPETAATMPVEPDEPSVPYEEPSQGFGAE